MSKRLTNSVLTKKVLYKEYYINDLCINDIAKKYGVSKWEPRRLFEKFSIPIKTKEQVYNSKRRSKRISDTLRSKPNEWWMNKIQKTKKTSLEKYGVDNVSKSPEIIQKIKDRVDFEEVHRKTVLTLLRRYGVDNPNLIPGVKEKIAKSWHKNQRVNRKISLNEKDFCERLYKLLLEEKIVTSDDSIYFAPKTKQFGKYSKEMKQYVYYDFVIPNLQYCIEYNGDYWHANPELYTEDFKVRGRTAKEIWDRDKLKINLIESFGYKVILIWDKKYLQDKNKCLEEVVIEINKKEPV